MTVSVRLNEEDEKLIKSYAKINNMSLSDLIRKAIIEKIEDEYDLKSYEKAMKEYKKNPKTYTIEEAKEELGL
ncbi:MAG: ribbon-helix-helix protein, CopG family [Clostridia bacterium]|nr:ribbon-helix-helix protein, CopG family [Clostridia bacterium]